MLLANDVPDLDENQEVRERRNQLRHPNYTKPSCWPLNPTSYGAGIHLHLHAGASVTKLLDRPNGPIIICTTSWMSSAVTLSVG